MTEPVKRVYAFGKDAQGNNVTEGNTTMKATLGGKGANLAEMANIGLPVPPGFTISCQTCMEYANAGNVWPEGVLDTIHEYRLDLENRIGKKIGDAEDPLLVSVRSGAPMSMPGMMDTVLNLGLNDESINGLIKQTENPRFAWDSYRRFIQMFSNVVMGLDGDLFENAFRPHIAGVGVLHARLTGNRESRRNGTADVGHLGEVRALAAERCLHGGVALGYVVSLSVFAKRIDALHWFGHLVLLTSSGYLFTHDVGKRDLRRNISRTFPFRFEH